MRGRAVRVRAVRRISGYLAGAVLALGALLGSSGCVMVPALGVKTERNVVFTPPDWSKAMKANVYLPEGEGPRPAVLLLHGGGITDSGGRWQMAGIAGKLAQRGYVVVNATYRTAPKYQYPVPLQDVKAALDWMRANSDAYGIDRQRIATFGYSAGGYLASLVALTDDAKKDRVAAIVTGGAPSDMVFYAEGRLVPNYLGGRLYEVPGRFYEASPANFVKRSSPPIFIYHGSMDRLVRPEHPLLMMEAYRRAGAHYEVRVIPGKGHIMAFLVSEKEVEAAIDFLDRQMKR